MVRHCAHWKERCALCEHYTHLHFASSTLGIVAQACGVIIPPLCAGIMLSRGRFTLPNLLRCALLYSASHRPRLTVFACLLDRTTAKGTYKWAVPPSMYLGYGILYTAKDDDARTTARRLRQNKSQVRLNVRRQIQLSHPRRFSSGPYGLLCRHGRGSRRFRACLHPHSRNTAREARGRFRARNGGRGARARCHETTWAERSV